MPAVGQLHLVYRNSIAVHGGFYSCQKTSHTFSDPYIINHYLIKLHLLYVVGVLVNRSIK